MKPFRVSTLFASLLLTLPACATPQQQSAPATDDAALGHALTLVEMFVHAASQSDDPAAGLKAIDDVLAGRNAKANQAFAGLLDEATAGMPAEQRDQVASIGQDLAALARRESSRMQLAPIAADRALQARKDLTAMGLSYYDQRQFLDAVKRDDALAVQLYLAGRGVNPSAKGPDGRSALDIARDNRNGQLEALLSRNLPAGH